MQSWTYTDTKCWIKLLENRVNDFTHFLNKTNQWCEDNYIHDEDLIFICHFLTCIWVSTERDEPITYSEIMEMLGFGIVAEEHDKLYELGDKYRGMTHSELMRFIIKTFE